jgi:curved DNA-binding protein CbpA
MSARGDRSYYARLEVGQGASHDEIVHAYRRLAMDVHPDAHPEDPDGTRRFREITEAYEVLGDPKRRADYDRRLRAARIQPRVHLGPQDAAEPISAWAGHEGEPVFLGTVRPGRGGPFLRVGPVWHRHVGRPDVADAQAGRWFSDVPDLLRMIADWWPDL